MEEITQQDLEQVAFIFDQIKNFLRTRDISTTRALSDDLEEAVTNTMSDISTKICEDLSAESLQLHIITSRYNLFKFCAEKVSLAQEDEASSIWTQIFFQVEKIFQQVTSIGLELAERLSTIQEEFKTSKKEQELVLQAAEELERTAMVLTQERDVLKGELERIQGETQGTINQLEEENKKYLEKIIKLSKHSAENSLPAPPIAKKEIREVNPYNSMRSFTKSVVSPTVKDLTLKQMKDFIEELYLAKSKFDLKCNENKMKIETLQQYLLTYLITKYGLKSLANDWVSAIERAISKFSSDVDIQLFGKILRNEVNEDFYITFRQVREASLEVLKQHFKSKFPFNSEKNLKSLVDTKKSSDLEEEEWLIIVKTLHEEQDQEEIIRGVAHKIWNNSLSVSGLQKRTKKISFNELMQTLLEFQMNSHEEYLRPLLPVFREHDYNGVLTHQAFFEVMSEFGIEFEATRFVKILDPNLTDSITSSNVISLFTTEMIEGEVILRKLYNELNTE
jgi:hypothetical protein